MTIVQSDTVLGLEYGEVKPASRARMLKQFEQIAKDQTALYKQITNINAPNTSSSPQALGHDHSGSGLGAPISIPLLGALLDVQLLPQESSNYQDWQSFGFIPFFVPDGITEVRVMGIFDKSVSARNFKFSIMSSTFSTLSIHRNLISSEENIVKSAVLTVNTDEVNILRLEGWIGQTNSFDGNPIDSKLHSIHILPTTNSPNLVQSFSQSKGALSSIFPDAAQYDGEYFTSFSSVMFEDDAALSSYILASTSMNDALNAELLHGVRATSTDTATLLGHNHEQSTTNLDKCGAAVQHPLGAWHYGGGLGSGFQYDPDSLVTGQTWKGKCEGFSLLTSATSFSTFAKHAFSYPNTTSAKYGSGTSDITASITLNLDHGKSGDVTIRARILQNDLASSGSWVTATETGTGRQLVTLSGLDILPYAVGGAGEYVLEIQAKQELTASNSCVIYASSLHLS